jgi:hypothetical protein
MARSTMTALIARVRSLLNDPDAAIFTDDQIEDLLDERSVVVSVPLATSTDTLTHRATTADMLETDALVYAGVSGYGTTGLLDTPVSVEVAAAALTGATLLTATTDYTLDAARGIVTTLGAETRGLWLVGRSYDIYGAAADGWEQVASGKTGKIDLGDAAGNVKGSQLFTQALVMADRLRRRAWPGVY